MCVSDHSINEVSFFGKMILDFCDTKFGVWVEGIRERGCDVKGNGMLDAVFDGEYEWRERERL